MAVVYQGRDRVLGRPVAVKVLRDQYVADAAFLDRFGHEAQSAAALSHPNIVNIYDVGEDQGLHYIVMEFVPGRNLKDLIRADGPFNARHTVELGRQICAALGYAHHRGLIHRDIKPQNILVTPEGLVKVADFGIAKGLNDTRLTASGVAMGTVHYAAPEQVEGREAIPASDIYAAGVVLYEMLTSRLPFDGETPVSIALKHINEAPPRLRSFNPQVPAGLETVVLTALAKDPEERFPSAEALGQALTDYQYYSSPRTAVRRGSVTAQTAAVPVQRLAKMRTEAGVSPTLETTNPRATTASRRALIPAARPRDDIGCLTWIAGVAGLGILLGLVFTAFTLVPRIIGQINAAPPATVVAAPTPRPTAGPPTKPPGAIQATPSPPGAPKPTDANAPVVVTSPTATPTITATPLPSTTPTITTTPLPPTVTPTPTPIPRLPDLRGRTLPEAQASLQPLGLTVVEVNKPGLFSDRYAPGQIAEQVPEPGSTLQAGSSVRVTLSRGKPIAVPNLVNQEGALAAKQLTDIGLQVRMAEEPSREIAAGRVIRSEPPAGSALASGTTVTLFVSIGDRVRVPDLYGKPIDEARHLLEEAGLKVGGVTEQTRDQIPEAQRPAFDRVPPGGVLSATPNYGTVVERGTIIVIAIRKR